MIVMVMDLEGGGCDSSEGTIPAFT